MLKLLQVNDLHLADRPPSKRTVTYLDDIFAKLAEITQLAKDRRVDAVVCTGDIFHHKSAVRVTHRLTNRVLSWVDELPCSFIVVPGNHDLSEDRIETVHRQPIGALASLSNVHLLLGGVLKPEWSPQVAFVGIPGVSRVSANDFKALKRPEDALSLVVVAHASIVADDRWYPYEVIRARYLAGVADVILWGHKHVTDEPFRLAEEPGGPETLFVNPGAISRGTLFPDDLNKSPQVALVTVDGVRTEVEYIKLKTARPAEEVYALDEVERSESREEAIEDFLLGLQNSSVDFVTRESLAKAITEADVDSGVREIALNILEQVGR